ncbi:MULTISPECIES: GNAT family N-acetyltransferase [unclassified Micromonospora]|uniref:GNAT family N-acetyltransferase n=1 Tax=unclassified Micromonospora TaxID=2617518 RepID=UPI00188E317E|nr:MULTISPECIES: GNAT family N-acetyltransferase [unclassified Micromonospora]MBF5032031.1 GNAT family N-acetyltransferase [Micromonospora sp. ANENR4]MCZ7477838.1 GNAT family N-acetyltransferase [Micromonospora sp. WMMC273]WBC02555.1 GNAT family N-acetyltransferase [Micromonospora sp. WMMA1976]
MSGAEIRPARPDDAPAVVALRALVFPYLVRGVESTRRMIAEPPPGEDWAGWVAEADGQIVGWVSAYRNTQTSTPGVGEIALLHVHPEHRRQGAGTALFDTALGHLRTLGTTRVLTHARTESLPFAQRHGFTASRELRYSALDLTTAPPMPQPPPGVRLVSAAGLDPRQVHRVDAESSRDEPGDVPTDALGFDLWRHECWDNPGLDREASTLAEVDGELVALSLVKRDGDRMWSDFTGTLPAYRGRGLARLTKQAALHAAAARGVRTAYTSNDEANAPMLAVNERLGYRAVDSQWSCRRKLM